MSQGRGAEAKHTQRQPYMRLEPLEQNIARDLEQYVGDKEDRQRRLILQSGQLEVLLQTENSGVGDVGTIEKGEQIE